ncbi:Rieske (2Fe-2S) protein [Novipirellula sp. SH528]|uniref:Rieske (2Fe-2S) protein n=1 Tax=Novipirellula sp. SH528 TaxID=3454466 RepID=UPI003F9FD89C
MSWIKAAKSSDVPIGTGKLVIVDDYLIALFNIDGVFYAIDDACPHQGAPLSEGIIQGCITVCPWHGAEFDVTNGKLLCGPGGHDVQAYAVTIKEDDVLIEIP